MAALDAAPRLGTGHLCTGSAAVRPAREAHPADQSCDGAADYGRPYGRGWERRSYRSSYGRCSYARAAEWADDAAIRQAVQRMLQWILLKAPRNAERRALSHLRRPQMSSDGINGAPPFLAAMGHYDEAMLQIEGYRKLLFNHEKKLMAHIWDDGKHELSDPSFWGGGNGWTAAGLACVIRSLPADRHKDRAHLAEFAREVIDGCLAHQLAAASSITLSIGPTRSSRPTSRRCWLSPFIGDDGRMASGELLQIRRQDEIRSAGEDDGYGFVQGACGAPISSGPVSRLKRRRLHSDGSGGAGVRIEQTSAKRLILSSRAESSGVERSAVDSRNSFDPLHVSDQQAPLHTIPGSDQSRPDLISRLRQSSFLFANP